MRTKLIAFALATFVFAFAPARAADQREMADTLKTWCDSLLTHQTSDGGILCPGCGFIHGRCADAIYPLLYLADKTGEARYLDAAKNLFKWSNANVRCEGGEWRNEIDTKSWKGVSVFTAIMLMESLRDYGRLLDDDTRRQWTDAAKGQLPYIMENFKIGYGNINYPASACYALALASELTGDKQYKKRAAQLAREIMKQFTPNDTLVFGEGNYPFTPSAKRLLPVDLGYNVEETLPNLLAYADLAGDSALRAKVIKSFRTHLEFMLGDGAWDNSWGTRNCKWTYWGSRTTDGILGMCSELAKDKKNNDPVFAEAGWRNFELLKSFTQNGLLYGGRDYVSAGYEPGVHHSFEHAKSLAHALRNGFGKPAASALLPREQHYDAKYFKDLDVWLVGAGDWRGTITGYDVDYHTPSGNAHGGTLSLLWNKNIGPVLAAAMIEYSQVEPNNTQAVKGRYSYPTMPRVEYAENGVTYTTAYFKPAVITHTSDLNTQSEVFTVKTELVDVHQKAPPSGRIPLLVTYAFGEKRIRIGVKALSPESKNSLTLYLPIISRADDPCIKIDLGYRIKKPAGYLLLSSGDTHFEIKPVEDNGRAFCPVPGFEFIPFFATFDREATADILLKIR